MFVGFTFIGFAVQEVLADGVAGEDDLIGREETVHAFVGHTDLGGFVFEDLVGDPGKAVLLLEEDGDAHLGCGPHGCTGGVAADADTDVGLEVTDDRTDLTQGLDEVDEDGDILPGLGAVEAADREADDAIARLGDTLHLHAPEGTDEEDIRLGVELLEGVGNTDCGENMSSGPAAGNKIPHGVLSKNAAKLLKILHICKKSSIFAGDFSKYVDIISLYIGTLLGWI